MTALAVSTNEDIPTTNINKQLVRFDRLFSMPTLELVWSLLFICGR